MYLAEIAFAARIQSVQFCAFFFFFKETHSQMGGRRDGKSSEIKTQVYSRTAVP